MKKRFTFLFVGLLCANYLSAQTYPPVQAIFNTYCTGCHGGGFQGLTLTSEADVLASVGSDCGQTIVPGDAANSPLVSKIDPSIPTCDGGGAMPQGGSLTAGEIATIRAWIDNLVTLSVEFVSFEAIENDKGYVNISFAVERQSGSAYFEIQRSENGIDFETISILEPQTSYGVQDYFYMDTEALINGDYYYRAVEIDYNDQQTISTIATVKIETKEAFVLSVFPNPASLSDRVFLTQDVYGQMQIFNDNGQVVLSKDIEQNVGQNEINLSGFGIGVYYIRVVNQHGVFSDKLIISK